PDRPPPRRHPHRPLPARRGDYVRLPVLSRSAGLRRKADAGRPSVEPTPAPRRILRPIRTPRGHEADTEGRSAPGGRRRRAHRAGRGADRGAPGGGPPPHPALAGAHGPPRRPPRGPRGAVPPTRGAAAGDPPPPLPPRRPPGRRLRDGAGRVQR